MKKLYLDAGPILRALTRSRAGPVLIALQCAITLAILTNAIFIIQDRLKKMARPSGVDVENVFTLRTLPIHTPVNYQNDIERDLSAIRALPGVADAAVISSLPLSGGGSSTGLRTSLDEKPGSGKSFGYYESDLHTLDTLGLKLVAGRNFKPEEIQTYANNSERNNGSVIASESYVRRIFPKLGELSEALGKPLYADDGKYVTIVGIVERLQTPWINWGELDSAVLLSQYTLDPVFVRYIVRAKPGERDRLMPEVEKLLGQLDGGRVVREPKTQADIEAKAYASYRAMATILLFVIVLIVAITALGIVGLASFNVNARKKQIGTRRALGAQKGDIVRYFLVESWLITTVGAVIGVGLSFALSWWMVNTFDLPRLDWRYIPVGVVFLWVLGQLAVLVPARRASQLTPALATRSV